MRSFGHERRVTGDVPQDGVGFGDESARRHFEQRHLAARILGEKLRRVAFALEDVDLDQVVRDVELRERQPNLVAIAGAAHRVERHHRLAGSLVDGLIAH